MSESFTPLDRLVREQIVATGPLRYDDFVELALYHPEHGFYRAGGRAGRRGDFLTSAEVGPLFGAVVAAAFDAEWERLGRPDPFTVVEVGAGPGTLAKAVLAAEPACSEVLRYVAVETSETQRTLHPDGVESTDAMPTEFVGVIFANELLDNLPFLPIERVDGTWHAAHVDVDEDGLVLRWRPVHSGPQPGLRVPDGVDAAVDQRAASAWVGDALSRLHRGRVIVIDYCRRSSGEVEMRTFAGHERGGEPLVAVGTKDITVDVDLGQLEALHLDDDARPAVSVRSQADWLRSHGIDELVAEGRAYWQANAAVGDLAALRMRSRVREAEALTEAEGLGGFTVVEWVVDAPSA